MAVDGQGCLRIKLIEYHDYRTLMGPCFISFSLPLFIPGVVLTVVGSYGNEQTFERFGGWHITGIVILSVAFVLFTAGIILRCCFRPVLSADIEQHLTPTSSMISGKQNLAYEKDNKIYSSNNHLKGNAKVGHRDTNIESGLVVSTHDSRERTREYTNGHVGKSYNDRKRDEKSAQNNDTLKNANNSHTNTPEESESVTHLPDIETYHGPVKAKRRKQTDSDSSDKHRTGKPNTLTAEAVSGEVKTKVTATVIAEAETSSGYRSREPSSDTNENSQFLPPPLSDEPVKRRKKKKKRRKHSSNVLKESTNGAGSEHKEHTEIELPDLRIKPVLVHDGTHHHPFNQHVHFEGDPVELDPKQSSDVESEGGASTQ